MNAKFSRRRFLTCASAFPLWASGARLLSAADADEWGGFPVGVQTISLRKYPLPEAIRHVQALGVRFIEFSASAHLPSMARDEQILQARELSERAGLTISAQGVNRFSKDQAANQRVFEFAKKLGIRTITANPQPDAETLASLEKLVAQYDLRVAIHNHGPDSLYDRLESVVAAITGRDKRIGVCVDCGHFLASGEDPVKCLETLKDRVYGVHLKDQAETGKKSPNVVLGKGHLDLVALFKALRKIRFPADGALSLEYETHPDNPLEEIKASLAAAKEAIAKTA